MATGGLNSAIRQSLGVCVCVVCPRACVCVMQIMSSDPAVVYNSKLHSNLFFLSYKCSDVWKTKQQKFSFL